MKPISTPEHPTVAHRRKAEGRGQRAEGKDLILPSATRSEAPDFSRGENRKICTEMAWHKVQGVLIQSPGFIHGVILLPSASCLLPSERPALAPHQQYVQWTEHHQHQAQGLPPCAIHFWQYLLYKYPGGVPQEIDLEEIRVELSLGRSKIYCVQSLKNALWKYLVPRGLVEVVKQFTKRIMRVVANHAGPTKEIEKKFEPPKFNLHSTKQICGFEAETLINPSSIQRNSEDTQTPGESGCCDDEGLEEIKAAIANAPFMQDDSESSPSPPIEPAVEDKFSAPIARAILERLRSLSIPLSSEVRSLVAKTPEAQLERAWFNTSIVTA